MGRRLKITRSSSRKHPWLRMKDQDDEEAARIDAELELHEFLMSRFRLLVSPRMYQQVLFLDSMKAPSENGLVVLPTGMGKTLIMAMYIHQFLTREQKRIQSLVSAREKSSSHHPHVRKVLVIAPTKPMITQLHERFFNDYLEGIPDDRFMILTGAIPPQKRKHLYRHGWIILATPQTIRNDIQQCLISWQQFGLCLMDEVHHARGNHAMAWIGRRFSATGEDSRLIGFSATPGNDLSQVRDLMELLNIKTNLAVMYHDDPLLKNFVSSVKSQVFFLSLPREYYQGLRFLHELERALLRKIRQVLGKNYQDNFNELLRLFKELTQKNKRLTKNDRDLRVSSLTPAEFQYLMTFSDYLRCRFLKTIIESQGFHPLSAVLTAWNEKALHVKGLARFLSYPQVSALAKLVSRSLLPHPKVEKLVALIKKLQEEGENERKIIVFVSYRTTVHYLSRVLNDHGIDHAVLLGRSRDPPFLVNVLPWKGSVSSTVYALEDFKAKDGVRVLLTTTVGEEGIDVGDCDVVINYDVPTTPLRVIQRRGRARVKDARIYYLVTKETGDAVRYHVMKQRENTLKRQLVSLSREASIKPSSSHESTVSPQSKDEKNHSSILEKNIHDNYSRSSRHLKSETVQQNSSIENDFKNHALERDFSIHESENESEGKNHPFKNTKSENITMPDVSKLEEKNDRVLVHSSCLTTVYPGLLRENGFSVVILDDDDPRLRLPHSCVFESLKMRFIFFTPIQLMEIVQKGLKPFFSRIDEICADESETWLILEQRTDSDFVLSSSLLIEFHVQANLHGYPVLSLRDPMDFILLIQSILSHSDHVMRELKIQDKNSLHVTMLSRIKGISPLKARKILSYVSFHQLTTISEEQLRAIPGVGAKLARRIISVFQE